MTSAAETHYTERMRQLLTVPVTRLRVAGAQHGYQHLTATLADGRAVFAKAAPGPGQAAAFAAEANGLRWLAQARAVPVPRVLGLAEDLLVIEALPPGRPTAEAAAGFGAGLARLHAAGRRRLRRALAGLHRGLPLDNAPGQEWASGTRSSASFRTCARRVTAAPCPARTSAWSRPWPRESGSWPAARAAEPHSRRPVVGERAVVRRARLADRPGRARRAPGDRPGDARAVRRAAPGGDPARLPRRRRWPTAGGTGSRCTSCTRCLCRSACSPPSPRPSRRAARPARPLRRPVGDQRLRLAGHRPAGRLVRRPAGRPHRAARRLASAARRLRHAGA